jgi:uncharacterized protein
MRTTLCALLCAALLAGLTAQVRTVEEPVEIRWEQLMPTAGRAPSQSPAPWGVVQHGLVDPTQDPAGVVTDYDGKPVRIAGFMVPLEFDGVGVRTFLLVPYFGACIHVPPPPPNQIILVRSEEEVRVGSMFEPVTVTGTLKAAALATELADVGYRLAADTVAPYAER